MVNFSYLQVFFYFKSEYALLFDSVFALSHAIQEAEKHIDFNGDIVSCDDNKSLRYGTALSKYMDRVTVNGLSGLIKFENRQRKEIDMDVLQLKEVGLVKVNMSQICL